MQHHLGRLIDHVHLRDLEATKRSCKAVLGARGVPVGRECAGCYVAFLLDPEGNNVEAVHRGPVRRSAASITLTP